MIGLTTKPQAVASRLLSVEQQPSHDYEENAKQKGGRDEKLGNGISWSRSLNLRIHFALRPLALEALQFFDSAAVSESYTMEEGLRRVSGSFNLELIGCRRAKAKPTL
jgi:hypothetical protein